jgi:hypothetical protein
MDRRVSTGGKRDTYHPLRRSASRELNHQTLTTSAGAIHDLEEDIFDGFENQATHHNLARLVTANTTLPQSTTPSKTHTHKHRQHHQHPSPFHHTPRVQKHQTVVHVPTHRKESSTQHANLTSRHLARSHQPTLHSLPSLPFPSRPAPLLAPSRRHTPTRSPHQSVCLPTVMSCHANIAPAMRRDPHRARRPSPRDISTPRQRISRPIRLLAYREMDEQAGNQPVREKKIVAGWLLVVRT